jgi:DNA repair protein RadA/Sms
MGEVGLAGELRAVSGLTRRVREAQRLGATDVLVPWEGELEDVAGVKIHRRRTLVEAIVVAQSGTI